VRTKVVFESRPSFFNFFSPPAVPDDDDEDEEAMELVTVRHSYCILCEPHIGLPVSPQPGGGEGLIDEKWRAPGQRRCVDDPLRIAQTDFRAGSAFKTDLIPHAVMYFTGDAVEVWSDKGAFPAASRSAARLDSDDTFYTYP
jgi:hypothetical protein